MKFSTNYQPHLQRSRFRVFVYGSLRKGFGNHALLQQPSTKLIAFATIRAKLFTEHWGWPFICFSRSNKDCVVGEIYEVDYATFQRLDSLEGYRPGTAWSLFNRKHATATLVRSSASNSFVAQDHWELHNLNATVIRSHFKVKVWVYEGGSGLQHGSAKTEINSGDWKIAKEEHTNNWPLHHRDATPSYRTQTSQKKIDVDQPFVTSHTSLPSSCKSIAKTAE